MIGMMLRFVWVLLFVPALVLPSMLMLLLAFVLVLVSVLMLLLAFVLVLLSLLVIVGHVLGPPRFIIPQFSLSAVGGRGANSAEA
jgi:hypothetical protein